MPDESEREPTAKPGANPELAAESERRLDMRRRLVRANTAVAIVLVAVLGLALAAVLASLRATHHRRVAENAQAIARTELWRTYLSQARAARLGSALERRQESMRAIADAAAIQPSAELRHEAIAALAMTDFVLEHTWPLSEEVATQAFDRELRHYAVGLTNGDIAIRRIADNQAVQWLRQTNGEVPAAQGPAIGLEFSPEGDRLAARYQKGGALVWEVATAKAVFRQALDQPRQPLSRPRFTSDGRFLVCMTAVPRGGVAVFDLSTGQSVAHFPQFPPWMHATPRPGTTMFSVNTESNVVLVLDWRTGRTVMSFPFPASIQRMAWSPAGKYLAVCGSTVDVHLWNTETGEKRVLTGHTMEVRHLAFDVTGARLASASWDATSRIWETHTGRLLGVTDRGFAEQFGENGRLAFSRFKGAVEIWSLRQSPVHRMHLGPGPAEASSWAMDLSPDGRWLTSLIENKGLAIWDLVGGGQPVWLEMPRARMLCFHPDQPDLYLTSRRQLAVRRLIYDPATTPPTPRLGDAITLPLPTNFSPNTISVSRNGRTMALASVFEGRTYVTNLAASEQVVWPEALVHITRTGAQNPGASATGGGTLALSSDGHLVACGFVRPNGTRVWDARSGEPVATISAENSVVEFSPDDRWLAAGDRSHYRLIRVGDWREQWRVSREGALLTAGPCAFSPDGRRLAVAKSPQLAAILDTATGVELAELVAPRPATIQTIRWSSDGRRLVMGTGENLVQVWEVDALRSELRGLDLDWETPGVSGKEALTRKGGWTGFIWALVSGVLAAGVVTLVALLALRRHRRLIEDFARTEALAGQRDHELRAERELGRLKSNFVSMVSHEFRTPLGVIRAAGESLTRYFERLSHSQRVELLGDIARSTRRMNDLIEEVLLLGKVEAGRMECRPAPVDLAAVCRRVLTEVRTATQDVCPIEFTSPGMMPDLKLDEGLIVIILSNLVSNAVKYSPPGRPVRLGLHCDTNHVTLEVRDEGIGIPAVDQAGLFKSFHRAANVGQIPGSGLGLTIVKRCVDLHDGEVSFKSQEGKGTTFTVRIPVAAG